MCLFCKIVSGQVPAKIAYEDEDVVAFHDISPQAPVHLLVIPRKHIESLSHAEPTDEALLGKLMLCAARVAKEQGLDSKGFRVVVNNGALAGQTVFHIHVHVLGGRAMAWPPG